ncbi:Metalloprotease LoiP [Pandoraea terrae]|uniref:Metalloprotease LoiP n=1 Tax=Pandoraea terrae TaxID=1537710 RepID=A0A5E4TUG7_9BURK|nr:M48 family metallopeptidase [Pandoraea terrae]VVD90234.1 Metalloprotease LoiP [Pandoraea terrae]
MTQVDAYYFDGRTSARHRVVLSVEDDVATVRGDGIERQAPLRELRVSERAGAAPRLVTFADGAFCEIGDHPAFERLLAQTGWADSAVVRWQSRWRTTWIALAAGALVLLAAYRWGVPWMAEQIATRLPSQVAAAVGQQALTALDQRVLRPSRLPLARQRRIIDALSALHAPGEGAAGGRAPLPAFHVHFRDAPAMGANAFALPSGDLIVTDQLITLAGDDDTLVIAVLAHELGHLQARHGMRMLVQGSIVGAAVALYTADLSSIVSGMAAASLSTRYSREFETQADDYAAALLRANGLSPARLADMLEKMTAGHGGKAGAAGAGGHDGDAQDKSGWDAYFSTHPDPQARIARLRRGGG